jgi:hypothetical protein
MPRSHPGVQVHAETTAVQRLGHVLGWTGNALAGLLVLAGTTSTAYHLWSAWNPDIKSGYSIKLEGGTEYIAIGTGYSGDDAAKAVQKYVGEEVNYGPYGDWKVFPVEDLTNADRAEMDLEREKVRAIERARARRDAWEGIGLTALLLFAPAVLIFLAGQALRYIFAGSRKRVA